MENKYFTNEARICYVEIITLVIAMFAFSYIFSENYGKVEKQLDEIKGLEQKANELKKEVSVSGLIIGKILDKIKQPIIQSVSAQEEDQDITAYQCCKKNSDGVLCQGYPLAAINSVCEQSNIFPGKCEDFSDCQLGCCYDSEEGICATRSPRLRCEEQNGNWTTDEGCNNLNCKNGCCILGTQAVFTTEQRCEKLAGLYGLPDNFKSEIPNEPACILLAETDSEGACIVGDGGCRFTTKGQCMNWTEGDITKFNKNYLCSNSALNTICERQNYTRCVEGKDGVYWFDSCGNQENIYNTNKAKSWNNGVVLSVEDSCNAEANNANNPNCGNCQHFFGSICRKYNDDIDLVEPNEGEFICRDLDCHNVEIDGKVITQKNGESWCVYDGAIGFDETESNPVARDTVGSRHWRYVCYMGEVRVEPCSDYRNGLCVQQNIDFPNGEIFSSSSCRMNRWQECISYNMEEDRDAGMEKCERHPDCWINEVRVDSDFSFDICAARYPEGFDLNDARSANSAKQLCGLGSQTCIKIEEKKVNGNWKCIAGCDCDTPKMVNEMQAVCASLGDCGAGINYIGEFTSGGYSIRGAPTLSQGEIDRYKGFKKVIPGLYALPGDMSFLLKGFLHPQDLQSGIGGDIADIAADQAAVTQAGTYISGATGVTAMAISQFATLTVTSLTATGQGIAMAGQMLGGLLGGITGGVGGIGAGAVTGEAMGAELAAAMGETTTATTTMGAIGNFLGGFAAGMAVSSIMTMVYGLQGDAALTMTIVGIAGGAVMGLAMAGAIGGGGVGAGVVGLKALAACLTGGPVCIGVIILIILIATFFKLAGIGDIKETEIKYECYPWKQPYGGDNCEQCTENPLKPCTKYRCQSLGMGCEFINQGTENELCIYANPHDVSSPVITPLENAKTEGINYTEISKEGFKLVYNQGCLLPFSPIVFGIKTNELAVCKFDQDRGKSFEEMQEYFGGESLLAENHHMSFALPSPQSVIEEYGLTSEPNEQGITSEFILNKFGNLNYFVKCKDAQGNENEAEFTINFCVDNSPDLTPPIISSVNPLTGGYLAKHKDSMNLSVWTNEPANCKWDKKDTSYNFMQNEMLCLNSLINQEGEGFPCKTFLTGLKEGENKFYIRCQDTSNQTNIMQESYEYIVNVAEAELEMEITSPHDDEIFYTSNVYTTAELKIKTSEGVENGKARCDYSFNREDYIIMQSTYSKLHRQVFNTLINGNYTIWVRCEDVAGNLVNDSVSLSVDVDIRPPSIVRAYFSNNQLKIITNENADCKYANQPNIDFENKQEMFDIQKEHTIPWEEGSIYYVECKDSFGNKAEINLESYQIVGI